MEARGVIDPEYTIATGLAVPRRGECNKVIYIEMEGWKMLCGIFHPSICLSNSFKSFCFAIGYNKRARATKPVLFRG